MSRTTRSTDDDDDIAADDAAAVVESDLAQLENERTELVDTLRRVQADFENYRKRVLREQTALVDRATDRLVEDLLPVLDSFDGALGSLSAATRPRWRRCATAWSSIRAQLVAVLGEGGPRAHRRRRHARSTRTSTRRCCRTTAR